MNDELNHMGERLISRQGVQEMLGCGRNKALLVMHAVGPVYVGKRIYIRASDFFAKLDTEGEIKVKWTD